MSRFWQSMLVAAAILPGTAPAQNATSLNASEIASRVVAAYGNPNDVMSVLAYRLDADITAHARQKRGAVSRISEGPDQLTVMVSYATDTEIRIFKDGHVWRGPSFQKLTPASGPLRSAVILQAARSYLPWLLVHAKNTPRLESNGDDYHVLDIEPGEDMLLRVFVDKKTFLISRAESLVKAGEKVVIFRTEYSDYREIGGVLFPFLEENYASGVHTATTNVRGIKLNPSSGILEAPSYRMVSVSLPVDGSLPASEKVR